MKKFLSITLSVVFVLMLAVIPAFAVYRNFASDVVPNEIRVYASFAAANKNVEAGTMILSLDADETDNSCAAFIYVIYSDNSSDQVAIDYGMMSATATFNATSIYDSLSAVGSEHYGFYYDDVLNEYSELIVGIEVNKLNIQ